MDIAQCWVVSRDVGETNVDDSNHMSIQFNLLIPANGDTKSFLAESLRSGAEI
jgi:hypothetical protein